MDSKGTLKENIIFFDGVCNLCDGFVNFLFLLGLPQNLKVASLQGESAQNLLSQEERLKLSSVLYLKNGEIYRESSAVIHIMMDMGWMFKPMGLFLILPGFLRDPVYRFIAKNRYRFFGKKSTCRLPEEHEKKFFLN